MSTHPLYDHCSPLIGQILANYGWKLVEPEDGAFIEAVLQRLPLEAGNSLEAITQETLLRPATNAYCFVLHEAYKQDGTERQIQAMTEVQHYVHQRLLLMTGGDESLADECTQDAISAAWRKWDKIQKPGSFLAFVLQIAIRNWLAVMRKKTTSEESYNELVDKPMAEVSFSLKEDKDLEKDSETDDYYTQFQEVLKKCLSRLIEIEVLTGFFITNKSFKQLAEEIGKPAETLHMIKFKALGKLKRCDDFQQFWNNWEGGQ